MSRSLIRQLGQIRSSATYDDQISDVNNVAVAESTTSGTLENDINIIRTLVKQTKGTDNWYDAPDTNLADLTEEVSALDSELTTASGFLQDEIDATNTAIIWEVDGGQLRPKATYQGNMVYTYGDLYVEGNLLVSGTTTTVNTTELTVEDKLIIINNGEAGAGVSGDGFAGIEVDRGTEDNYYFYFDEGDDVFRIGVSGSLQAVATREDSPTAQYVAFWNDTAKRFDTAGGISVDDIASESFVATVSGNIVSYIDNNFYSSADLDGGQLDNRYYTESEIDILFSSLSGTLSGDYYTKTEIDTNFYTSSETDTAISTALSSYYTSSQVDTLLAGQNEFLELSDVAIASYSAGRVLFTTASGVVDSSSLVFDGTKLTVPEIQLGSGSGVDSIVTTISGGSSDSELPTAKAVWDLTEAAASAVHSHYNVDGVYVSNTSWTYGTGFAEVPDMVEIYVNGVKQRVGASYDCTIDVPAGVLTITFNYNVYSTDWVNITYTA